MRKIRLIPLFALVTVTLVWGKSNTYISGFTWYNPRIMAMGGDVSADPDGMSALASNPAGFIGDKSVNEKTGEEETKTEFTLVSLEPTLIANPFGAASTFLQNDGTTDVMTETIEYLFDQIEENGLGFDINMALGAYVGKGWGVGTFISGGTFFPQSDLALATSGEVLADLTVVIGYAYEIPFPLFDLTIGGDLRPTYRVIVPLTADDLLNGIDDTTSLTAYSGAALGLDVGATLEYQELTASLVFKDVGHTWYNLYETTLSEVSSLTSGTSTSTQYITPMSMTIGLGYEPKIEKITWLVKTSLVAAYKTDLLIGIDSLSLYNYTKSTFYKSLHMGIETKWLDFLYLRAGLNGGYFTAGSGIDFLIGEFNMAVFSTETGRTAGQTAQMGTSFELAFRW